MAAQVKVMQIIARMNVGGPAVIVAELMRGLDKSQFEQILVTGYCDENEADYLDTVAKDIKATRIAGLGRSVSLIADLKAFFGLVSLIRKGRCAWSIGIFVGWSRSCASSHIPRTLTAWVFQFCVN